MGSARSRPAAQEQSCTPRESESPFVSLQCAWLNVYRVAEQVRSHADAWEVTALITERMSESFYVLVGMSK